MDNAIIAEDMQMLLEYFLKGESERELLNMGVSEDLIREAYQYYVAVYFD